MGEIENQQPQLVTRYVQAGMKLHIEPFESPESKVNIGGSWEEWVEIFEEELKLQKVTEVDDMIICLKRYGGKEIRSLVKHLPDPPALNPAPKKNRKRLWENSKEIKSSLRA